MLRRGRGFGVETTRLAGIIVIVTLSGFLAISLTSKDALLAVIGLFGTIAGYLIGRREGKDE